MIMQKSSFGAFFVFIRKYLVFKGEKESSAPFYLQEISGVIKYSDGWEMDILHRKWG